MPARCGSERRDEGGGPGQRGKTSSGGEGAAGISLDLLMRSGGAATGDGGSGAPESLLTALAVLSTGALLQGAIRRAVVGEESR